MNKYNNSSGTNEGGCMSSGFAKKILSITSLKSSSSSLKSGSSTRADEILKLRTEIGKLKDTVDHLNNIIDDKDAAIGNLAREKENLYSELKKIQRVNRNIHQQLEDERDFYQKEKEHYCQEIINVKRYYRRDGRPNYEADQSRELEKRDASTEECLLEKDKVIYNLCLKYLRIKASKAGLKNKIHRITAQHQRAYEYIMSLLDANKSELDKVISAQIQDKTLTKKKYMSLVKRNARLHYENSQMKIMILTNNHKKLYEKPSKKLKSMNQAESKPCKSDEQFQEWDREATLNYNLKRSLYTHSNELTNMPKCLKHRRANIKYKPVELVYPKTKMRRTSSDPG